jgi:hypothetical protein
MFGSTGENVEMRYIIHAVIVVRGEYVAEK